MYPRKYKNGDKFGRLTIVDSYCAKNGRRWKHLALCDCGNRKEIEGADLGKGRTRSCGCLLKELKTSHGMSNSPEYKAWNMMIQRCTNPSCKAYKNYGGRGITVCDRWLDFNKFISDMGERPEPNSTVERVNNEQGYSPENCVWADRVVQAGNQRVRKDNKTGCKGVFYNKKSKKYEVSIQRNNKRISLGSYANLSEAVEARKSAETTTGGSNV